MGVLLLVFWYSGYSGERAERAGAGVLLLVFCHHYSSGYSVETGLRLVPVGVCYPASEKPWVFCHPYSGQLVYS